MPSFEEFILAAPLNFPRGCRTINNMQSSNPSQLETLCLEVKQKKLDNLGTDAFETLQYIFASISKSLPPPSISQVASVLDTSTYLSRDSITAIASVASSEEDNSLVSNNAKTNGVENLQWKIGIAVASGNCKNLMSPYIKLTFDVRDQKNEIKNQSLELSIQEFQEFRQTFIKVASVMDTM